MKNIFKLMGIALAAGSMLLVSCGKDKEAVYSATVSFGGAAWTTCEGIDVKVNDDLVTVMLNQKKGEYPQMLLSIDDAKKNKTYTVQMGSHEATDEQGTYTELDGFSDKNIKSLKYYSHKYTNDEGKDEADFWAYTGTIEVTAFDADDAEVSCTVAAMMFNYENWYNTDLSAEQLTQMAATLTTTMVDAE